MAKRGSRTWTRLACLAALVLLLGLGLGAFLVSRRNEVEPAWPEISADLAAQRWPAAEAKLTRWIAARPGVLQARLMLARARLQQGKHEEALEALRPITPSARSWLEAQALMGEAYLAERRASDAEACYCRVTARDERAIEPRRRLVYLYSLQGRNAEARETLWEIYRILDDARVLVDLVLELVKLREDVRGLGPDLEAFLRQTPDDPFLKRGWGMNLLYQGEAAAALPYLESAAAALVNDPEGRFALAECLIQLGKTIDEEAVLGPPPEDAVDRSQWSLYRGRVAEALGRTQDTERAYREAIAQNPENREAVFRLGKLLARLGRTAESASQMAAYRAVDERLAEVRIEHSRIRREGFSQDPALFSRLGDLCAAAGMNAEARAWFQEAMKVDPSRSDLEAKVANLEAKGISTPMALALPRLRPDAAVDTATGRAATAEASRGETGGGEGPLFEDVAAAAGVNYSYDCGPRADLFLVDTMGGGVGLIDHDGDGWLDIYFVNSCVVPYDPGNPPRPNRLYRNLGNGTFQDVTQTAGVAGLGCGMGCAVADYDNDGDDDLFVTGYGATILYRNRGDGTFEDVTAAAGVGSSTWSTAAGFGDLDADGDLDLVVINYVEIDASESPSCKDHAAKPIHCSPGRYPAQDDLLYRNNGDGTFSEVSKAAGFSAPDGRGLGLALTDLDEDGKLDIYVANDATADFLFKNLGAWQFREVAAESGIATNGSGLATASMGVAADDLDGDGQLDLFITNFLNEPNSFFRNLGQGLFLDATLAAGLDAPSRSKTGFGCAALDVDNDGRLDLFVSNGHVDDQPWANSPMSQVPHFFRGRQGGRFDLAGDAAGSYFSSPKVGRGVALGDLDNDGKLDLVVVHRDAPASILRNVAPGGRTLGVRLRGKRSTRTPVGARVTCQAGGRTGVRWLTSGTGYLSAHDSRLWFGLGAARSVERLEVRWPSGLTQHWTDLPVDTLVEIEEGNPSFTTRPLNSRPRL